MNFLFQSRPSQPEKVPSDKVVPLRSWDTALSMRETVLDVTLLFNDVLDIPSLRDGLDTLYSMGNWRELGARLRLNKNGSLEYHIPQTYDEARPAFVFSNPRHEISITSHPISANIPSISSSPQLFGSPGDLTSFVRLDSTPRKLDDWIYTDSPQLFLHTVSFSDASIITVTFPHTLADVMGIGIFLKAWSTVLRGDLNSVPALENLISNPLTELGQQTPAEKYIHYNNVLNKGQLIRFVAGRLLDQWWYRQEERRTIFLPAESFARLRQKAVEQVQEIENPQCANTTSFVSESDVVLAWLTRTLYLALGLQPSQRILVNNAFNLRTSLHDSFASPQNAYIANAVCMSPTFLRGQQIQDGTVGSISRQIRKSVAEQQTPEQVEAVTALLKATMEKSGYLALVGEPGMLLLSSSNWHKAGLYALDFSPVVTIPGSSKVLTDRACGKPSYVNGVLHSKLSFRNTFAITGRDAGGNWWLNGVLRTEAWNVVEQELEKL
uniref:Putative acetyltransferase n=1 Tax=Emericella variicolor TaxID=1549217 RepID=A0A1L7NQ54_EMEVA|nr:putative acetyltransferase [Aspergillus stellatus]